jgi:hypothetical protein
MGFKFVEAHRIYRLDFAAGDACSESYLLSKAIAQAVTANQPCIRLNVMPTGRTVENIGLLEAQKVQLATTAQADIPAGQSSRLVAALYRDLFLLVVKKNSEIHDFVDLKGKQIGLAPTSGQFNSLNYGGNSLRGCLVPVWLVSGSLQNQKDQTDEYIKSAVSCLSFDLTDQQELDQIFSKAVAALVSEEISQESFRTFNEVYKDVREALGRKI